MTCPAWTTPMAMFSMSFSVGGSIFWSGTSHHCRRCVGAGNGSSTSISAPCRDEPFLCEYGGTCDADPALKCLASNAQGTNESPGTGMAPRRVCGRGQRIGISAGLPRPRSAKFSRHHPCARDGGGRNACARGRATGCAEHLRTQSSIHTRRHSSAAPDVARFDLSVGRKLSNREHRQGRLSVRARSVDSASHGQLWKGSVTPAYALSGQCVRDGGAVTGRGACRADPHTSISRRQRTVGAPGGNADGVSGWTGFFQIEALAGGGKRDVCAGYPRCDERDYAPLETLFALALERRHVSSST